MHCESKCAIGFLMLLLESRDHAFYVTIAAIQSLNIHRVMSEFIINGK